MPLSMRFEAGNKGDKPGHEFHGNQYASLGTEAQSHLDAVRAHLDAAHDMLLQAEQLRDASTRAQEANLRRDPTRDPLYGNMTESNRLHDEHNAVMAARTEHAAPALQSINAALKAGEKEKPSSRALWRAAEGASVAKLEAEKDKYERAMKPYEGSNHEATMRAMTSARNMIAGIGTSNRRPDLEQARQILSSVPSSGPA